MAESQLVLSNALCFLLSRFGRMSVQQLTSVTSEFYKAEELIAAKERLIDDVNHLDPAVTLPHIPTRREGEARITRILDDIFTILTVVDENLRLKSLPKYVAESVDSMPALRLFDGDLAMLMDLLDKMNTRLSECGSSVAAMFSELLSLKEQVKLLSTSWPPLPRVSSAGEGGATGVGNSTGRKHKQSTARAPVATAPILVADEDNRLSQPLLRPGDSWAAAATSSPVIATSNRFAVLSRTVIDNSENDNDSDDQSFHEAHSRRSAKRMRQHSNIQQQQQRYSAENRQHEDGVQQVRRQRSGRLLQTGISFSTSVGGLAAAKSRNLVRKAVFCIDNVGTAFNADDVKRHVSRFSVRVISCFATKPRRRRGEDEPVTDRNAFRLCINADDRESLLDPAKWPQSVTISEWYHVPPSASRRRSDSGGRTDITSRGSSSEAPGPAAAVVEVNNEQATVDEMDHDDTVVEINLDTVSTENGV